MKPTKRKAETLIKYLATMHNEHNAILSYLISNSKQI